MAKRLLIHDQQDAIRLADAGLLRWADPDFINESGVYTTSSQIREEWYYEYETWCPHILVEDDDDGS